MLNNEGILVKTGDVINPVTYRDYSRISPAELDEIVKTIQENNNCIGVEITDHAFTYSKFEEKVSAFKGLKKIKIGVRDLKVCRKYDWGNRNPFVELVKGNDAIEELDLSGNPLGNDTVIAILKAINDNPNSKIRKLNLAGTSIDGDVADLLVELLASNKKLEVLNIGGNSLGAEAATKIANALKVNTTLKELYVNSCSIERLSPKKNMSFSEAIKEARIERAAAAPVFAEMLRVNTTLEILDLRSNRIRKNASIKIAKALGVNNTLKNIFIGSNFIPNAAAEAWADMIKYNSSLRVIDISKCDHLTEDGAVTLGLAFYKNKHLLEIAFWYGGLDAVEFSQRNKRKAAKMASSALPNPKRMKLNKCDEVPDLETFFTEYLSSTSSFTYNSTNPVSKQPAQPQQQTDAPLNQPKHQADKLDTESDKPQQDQSTQSATPSDAPQDQADKPRENGKVDSDTNRMMLAIGSCLVLSLIGLAYLYRNQKIICNILPKALFDMLSLGYERIR